MADGAPVFVSSQAKTADPVPVDALRRVLSAILTMDAEQGVEAIRIIQPRQVIPIHYNDYTVFKSPLEDFKKAAADAGFEDRVIYLGHGQLYNFEVPESRIRRAA